MLYESLILFMGTTLPTHACAVCWQSTLKCQIEIRRPPPMNGPGTSPGPEKWRPDDLAPLQLSFSQKWVKPSQTYGCIVLGHRVRIATVDALYTRLCYLLVFLIYSRIVSFIACKTYTTVTSYSHRGPRVKGQIHIVSKEREERGWSLDRKYCYRINRWRTKRQVFDLFSCVL